MLLLAIVVLSWGLSWYAIALQVGDVPPLVSVAWRFWIASVVLGVFLAMRGELRLPPRHTWLRTVLLGLSIFCFNFICFYHATSYVASGLVSIVFAMAVFMNSANQFIWEKVVPDRRVVIGSVLGFAGIVLVFLPSILGSAQTEGAHIATGLALSVAGTWLFSVGNLVSSSISRNAHLPSAIVYAMAVGATVCGLLALVRGDSFALPIDAVYLGALIYLAIGASVIAFVAYLTLVARLGAAHAGYATILFPLVALTVSTFLEGYTWTGTAVFGVALALSGAAIVFVQRSA